MARQSAGELTRLYWDGRDLQIQTEVRYGQSPLLTTILVVDGVVISRHEKPWDPVAVASADQQRISSYHKNLTQALQRLYDKQWVSLDDIPSLVGRLVDVAYKMVHLSRIDEALASLPGGRWLALIDLSGRVTEGSPSREAAEHWAEHLPAFSTLFNQLSSTFGVGTTRNACIRTTEGYIVAQYGETDTAVAAIGFEGVLDTIRTLHRLVEEPS